LSKGVKNCPNIWKVTKRYVVDGHLMMPVVLRCL